MLVFLPSNFGLSRGWWLIYRPYVSKLSTLIQYNDTKRCTRHGIRYALTVDLAERRFFSAHYIFETMFANLKVFHAYNVQCENFSSCTVLVAVHKLQRHVLEIITSDMFHISDDKLWRQVLWNYNIFLRYYFYFYFLLEKNLCIVTAEKDGNVM